MAVAFQTVSALNISNANVSSLVLTKPTGLAVGDLMVAYIFRNGAGTLTLPTGFTNAITNTDVPNGSRTSSVDYKIADSADVAASNFTWSWTLNDQMYGGLVRITGHDPVNPIGASNWAGVQNSGTPSFTNGITPPSADCLLLMFLAGYGNDSAIGGYAIATSNPTWTELWDGQEVSADGGWAAAAYASRPEITATGNSSTTGGEATMDSWCILLAVQPPALGPANLKSYNTNLKANVKSINTNLIANVKTLDTNI